MINEDSQVLEYALGILNSTERDSFEHRLACNEALREELNAVRSMLDLLVESTEPMPVRPEVRERLLQTVRQQSSFEGFVLRLSDLFDLAVDKVRHLLEATRDEKREAWEQTRAPGIELLHFAGGPAVAAADCGLVRLAPGTEFPRHTHNGDETALVMRGCLKDSDGNLLHPGDVSIMRAGSAHSFTAVGDESLLLAVVVHNGISFCQP